MINRRLIETNAPTVIGQQVHINHEGCPSGEDRKRRLYIKRTVGGIVAYCHHCCEHGFVREKGREGTRLSLWLKGKDIDVPSITEDPPRGFAGASLSYHGLAWLTKYWCNNNCAYFGGVYDEPHKVTLTLHNPDNTVIGWQVRNLRPDAKPKYITQYMSGKNRGDASWFTADKKHLVITEDYLSAYRVRRDTGLSSVALLKTSVSDRTLLQIAELNFPHISIWLDPDSAGVHGALEAYKKLAHFLPTDTMITTIFKPEKEPKECTVDELKAVLF